MSIHMLVENSLPGKRQSLYKSKVSGDFNWFQGYEEIYCVNEKVYECYFHGGLMR